MKERVYYNTLIVKCISPQQKSSSCCQLQRRHQIPSSAQYSPCTKQKPASALQNRRNSYGSGSKVNLDPSSPVARHGRSHLLSSTYHPKHSMLTRGGGGGTGLATESGGIASKQFGQGQGDSRSHRQPSRNDTSDLIVTSARIVSYFSPIVIT